MCDQKNYNRVQFFKVSSLETPFHETVSVYYVDAFNYHNLLLSFKETRSLNYNSLSSSEF